MSVTPIDWNAGGNTSLQEMLLSDKMHQDRAARSRIGDLIEPALGGDRSAMAGVYRASPDMGYRIAQTVGALELGKQRQIKEYTDFITHGAAGVLQAPPDQQPALYAQLLSEAQQRGYPLTGVPQQWDGTAKSFLTTQFNRAIPFATALKRIGGAGGGAPAADVWGPAGGGGAAPAPAPRVSAAPAPTGPVVADAAPPPGAMPPPTPAPVPGQGGAPGAAQPVVRPPVPQMAGAAPAPVAPPAAPQIASAPPVAPAPTPAQIAAVPPVDAADDSGQDRSQTIEVANPDGGGRVFRVPPGYRPLLDKQGKPMEQGGGIWFVPVDPKGNRSGPPELHLIPTRNPPRERTEDWVDETDASGKIIGQRNKATGAYKVIDRQPDGKPVDNSARDDLMRRGTPAVEVGELLRDFKPEFAGYKLWTGGLDNMRRRTFGDDTGQAQWWQRYDSTANEIRHGLFGASLTAGEKAAFDAAMVSTGMNPQQVTENLARQHAIMMRAAARVARGMIAGGMNEKAVEQTLGIQLKDLPGAFDAVPTSRGAPAPPPATPPGGSPKPAAPPPASGGQPKRLKFNPATGELE